MTSRGFFDRTSAVSRLEHETFDVLIVGGGITGCGCALDAASRGLSVGLIERDDFASGTSSKSSKMIHGGLRYLQQGDIRLVYEALRERQRLRVNAPHLVKVLPFLLPVLTGRDSPVPRKLARMLGWAMWAYDLTGGARIGKIHEKLDAKGTLAHFPTLRPERVNSSYLYYDARADDARLTLTVARTAAVDYGAVVANGVTLVAIDRDGGRVRGATVSADGREFTVHCRSLVNATGVWADDVRAIDEVTHPDSIRPAKGIHITVPWTKVRNDIAAVIPVAQDRRSIFVVPWYDGVDGDGNPLFTYLGTTDTDYDGPLDNPQCTAEDVRYILDAANAILTEKLAPTDVLGTWAGLRPLVKFDGGSTKDLSRRHRVGVSSSGVVTITGGKLTTYREMASDTINHIVKVLGDTSGSRPRRSRTARLALRGASGYDEVFRGGPGAAPVSNAVVEHLADRYGSEARVILAMTEADPTLAEPLVEGLPYLRAEAIFAVRYEMARTVDDVLSRRTRARLLARDASADAAGDVAALIATDLGLDDAQRDEQAAHYRALIDAERDAPGLPLAAEVSAVES